MSSRKAAASAPERRPGEAIESFEKAMKALGKRDFEKARDGFSALIERFPQESELLERARAYKTLCDRQLEKRPAFRPRNFDDLLGQGVYLHNRGEYEEAVRLFRQAVEQQPKNEHALYCLAASSARFGDTASALQALRSAIEASPAARAQARSDSDFDELRQAQEFQSLLQKSA
jgi:TolA-binding protein